MERCGNREAVWTWRSWQLNTLTKLDWREFERLLTEAFEQRGYWVDHTGDSGPDGGIDLRLRKDGRITLVQAKHWRSRQVGVKIVREI